MRSPLTQSTPEIFAILIFIFFLAPAGPLGAQCESKVTASDASPNAHFGHTLSLSGDVALINNYVYRFDGVNWVEEQILTTSQGTAPGKTVSIDGDVALFGLLSDDDHGWNAGAAYIFRFDGTRWVEEQKLTASDATPNDQFGFSVSVSGDVALIGAKYNDDDGYDSGSAYIFRYDGTRWVEEQKLTASDASELDEFGYAVSLHGDVAVVGGAFYGPLASPLPGAAYVYRYDGGSWIEEQKLMASDGESDDRFGASLSVAKNAVLIGAKRDDHGPWEGAGSAYIFRHDKTGWVEEQKLTASDSLSHNSFGRSVSLSGDVALVGAHLVDGTCPSDPACESGAAYYFRYDGMHWEEHKLTASDAQRDDRFGWAVSVSENVGLIGAPNSDDAGLNSGSAYLYECLNLECFGKPYGLGTSGTTGIPTIRLHGGGALLGNDDLRIVSSNIVRSGIPGFLLVSPMAGCSSIGTGTKINVGMPLTTLLTFATGGLPIAGLGRANVPYPIPNDPALFGVEFFNQFLFVDSAGPDGLSASQGLMISICD